MKKPAFSRWMAFAAIVTQLPLSALNAAFAQSKDATPDACNNKPLPAESDVFSGTLGDIINHTEKHLDAQAKQIEERNLNASHVDASVNVRTSKNGVDLTAPVDQKTARAPGVLSAFFKADGAVQSELGNLVNHFAQNPTDRKIIAQINSVAVKWATNVLPKRYGSSYKSYKAADKGLAIRTLAHTIVVEMLRAKAHDIGPGEYSGSEFERSYQLQLGRLDDLRSKLPVEDEPEQKIAAAEPTPVALKEEPAVEKKADAAPAVETPVEAVTPPSAVATTPVAPEPKAVTEVVAQVADQTLVNALKEVPAPEAKVTIENGVRMVHLSFDCECLKRVYRGNAELQKKMGFAEFVNAEIDSQKQKYYSEREVGVDGSRNEKAMYGGVSSGYKRDECCLCDDVVAKVPGTIIEAVPSPTPVGTEPGVVAALEPSPTPEPVKDIPICEITQIKPVEIPIDWPKIARNFEPIPVPEFKLDLKPDAVWQKTFVLFPDGNSRQGVTAYAGSSGVLPGNAEKQLGAGYARRDEYSGTLFRLGRLVDPTDEKLIQPGDSRFPSDGINSYMQPVVQYDVSGIAMGSLRTGSQDGVTRVSPALEAYYSGMIKPNVAYPFSRTGDAMSPLGLYAATYVNWAPFLQNNKNAAFIGGIGGDIGLGGDDYVRPFVGVATHTFTSPADPSGGNGHHRGAWAFGADARWGDLLLKSYYAIDPYNDDQKSNASATVLANYSATSAVDIWGIYNYGTNNAHSRDPGPSGSGVRMGVNWFFNR